MLNLPLVCERFGKTEEYLSKPLFRNRRLNRALIIKHALRPHERELVWGSAATATKVILPYAANDLSLGGVSFMVGERRFERLLRESAAYANDEDFAADVTLLQVLNKLPSFDPFLLRERLRHSGVEPARCYFEIAEADIMRMRAFVGAEIGQLIRLAFATGGNLGGDLSSKLAEKLLTDETARSLDPLRQTLRLSGEEYVEGVFAWKGFLYYKWVMQEFRPRLARFRPSFAGCVIQGATAEERRELAGIRRKILEQVDRAVTCVDDQLLQYGAAFAALTEGQAMAFRDFLLRAPSMFIPIGEAVGVVKHIDSFWRFRFPDMEMTPTLPIEEAVELLNEFQATIASAEMLRSPIADQPSDARASAASRAI
ncbi:MAG: hypothetical protein NW206_04980 [Hyphomonadaceae bacterium]|nr:hypothetical protein [Hyphomonadaceae bacterium]